LETSPHITHIRSHTITIEQSLFGLDIYFCLSLVISLYKPDCYNVVVRYRAYYIVAIGYLTSDHLYIEKENILPVTCCQAQRSWPDTA
jgi:hypothetical protein